MSTEPAAQRTLPKNFLLPCVLLLLREERAHGYALLERLHAFGFNKSDPGGLYRALRALEEDGLVRSDWERSEEGPDRRIYEITRAGMEELHARAKKLTESRETLDHFLSRYEEFVALPRRGRGGNPHGQGPESAPAGEREPAPVAEPAPGAEPAPIQSGTPVRAGSPQFAGAAPVDSPPA
ncbi:MAG: helix-turn-helix transcriptional regulator [Actinomycetota bacterium]|nr:helix-turn-helix transcriptional regulator [Actinomycetota bacterium]